ncbi:MAG: twin transmembrane helix small protein [Alphaproteobacteria bacterium]|jgi:hypothetical protein|nr:twin transmembrane helix small protein [Alphaproteobacteria bacterium]MDP7222513.1 twin transmembrane helix small protein [Alphaproteobacteria bacterium]
MVSHFFFALTLLGMLAVFISMASGIFFMTKDTEKGSQNSNKMMRWRVYLQGLTLLFFVLAILTQ